MKVATATGGLNIQDTIGPSNQGTRQVNAQHVNSVENIDRVSKAERRKKKIVQKIVRNSV
jgi:hypothetical protein